MLWKHIFAGIIVVPGAAGGQLLGGIICKVKKLKVRGMTLLCVLACFLTMLAMSSLWANCEQEKIPGITVQYSNTWAWRSELRMSVGRIYKGLKWQIYCDKIWTVVIRLVICSDTNMCCLNFIQWFIRHYEAGRHRYLIKAFEFSNLTLVYFINKSFLVWCFESPFKSIGYRYLNRINITSVIV